MRLVTATLRNYRIHKDLSVAFDAARTLIEGPNEAGKSTLIEAIHHALFLPARVGGDMQRTMVSLHGAGMPEVELTFDARGARYTVSKRFAGQQGSVRLTRHGAEVWSGDEAETQLAELLGETVASTARGVAERVHAKWAHLWVWQRTSGDDPIERTREQHAALLNRLQQTGGAVVRQSAQDQRVLDNVRGQLGAYFTDTGKVKKNGDLERAESACEAAEEELGRQQGLLQKLEGAVEVVRRSGAEIAQLATQRTVLKAELEGVGARKQEADHLKQQLSGLAARHEAAQQALELAGMVEAEIGGYRTEQAAVTARLTPLEETLASLTHAHRAVRDACEAAVHAQQGHVDAARLAAQRKSLAEAVLQRLERDAELVELERLSGEVVALQQARAEHEQALEALPNVTQVDLDRLSELTNRHEQGEVALQAMAAGVEVVRADLPVSLAGSTLAAGETRVVTELTEIAIGDQVVLRIRPGGGDALAEVRASAAEAATALADELARLQVPNRSAAAAIVGQRGALVAKVLELDAQLRGMQADQVPARLEAARLAVAGAAGEVQRLGAALAIAHGLPETTAGARTWLQEQVERCQVVEREGLTARQIALEKAQERDDLADRLVGAQEAVKADQDRLAELRTLLADRLAVFGDDATRAATMGKARSAYGEVEAEFLALRDALTMLQPDLLAQDLERLERSLGRNDEQRQVSETALAVARAQLQLDGSQDPAAGVLLATAARERAGVQLAAVRERAEALRWLADLFQEEQRQLVDQYTRPLAAKIGEYLQRLYGPGAAVDVVWDGDKGELGGIRLSRAGERTPFDFVRLSGGTQEQLAAAVRLAIAEVLADEQGQGLPVVLDDAFVHSDPERLVGLQRMLDHAAGRGLQVVVLSCSPGDYAGLGAATVQLSRSVMPPAALPATNESNGSEPVFEVLLTASAGAGGASSSEDEAAFLAELTAGGGRLGNLSLASRLGWDEGRYGRVKESLLAMGRILPGRGRGGSVALPDVAAE